MTTFTEFNHPPLLGSAFRLCGKRDRKKKGKANAVEKASIPAIGHIQVPWVVSTSRVPTKGAVHVKDVTEKVRPISKMPA